MAKWQVALLSSLCTLVAVIMVIFIYTFIQSGVIEVIKEEIMDVLSIKNKQRFYELINN